MEAVEPLDQLGLTTAVVVHARTPSPAEWLRAGEPIGGPIYSPPYYRTYVR
jgi:hypothetical protein